MGKSGMTAINCYVARGITVTIWSKMFRRDSLPCITNGMFGSDASLFSFESPLATISMSHLGSITRHQERLEKFRAQTMEE